MIYCFEPIADKNSRVLILGTMPSLASLEKGEYYGHPRNAFWPLISAVLGEPYVSDYAARKAMLLSHNIALWDVVAACEREGSSDAAIRDVVPNNFTAFFAAHPKVRHIFFNGSKAYDLYKRHIGFSQPEVHFHKLGSTSPAHAVGFERRLKDWSQLADTLNKR